VVVRAPDLGGCLCHDCLGPGLLCNERVGRQLQEAAEERRSQSAQDFPYVRALIIRQPNVGLDASVTRGKADMP
jgi:hypothetical protein